MAASKVESGVPIPFNLTFSSSVTSIDLEKCYKCGHLVVMDVAVRISSTTAKTIDGLFAVPSGYRPSDLVVFTPLDNTNDIAMNGDLNSSGVTHIYRNHSTAMSAIRFHAEYIVP